MRTLVQLSDLHFGRVDDALIEPLLSAVAALRPDVVVVSGDLTQRAKTNEFEAARRFLDRLPRPCIVVPGNHDIPLYRVWERFLSPLGKYRRHVTPDLEPSYVDDEIAVLGLNTARALTWKDGRIAGAQVAALRTRLQGVPAAVTRIVVTHHPFDLPGDVGDPTLVRGAGAAMAAFAQCGVDLLLAGHLHTTQSGDTSGRYPQGGYAALAVQAGTATSTRHRGEENSFNAIRVRHDDIEVEPWRWTATSGGFEPMATRQFRRSGSTWVEAAA